MNQQDRERYQANLQAEIDGAALYHTPLDTPASVDPRAFFKVGPTELRILLAVGTLQLMRSGVVHVAGHEWLLFAVGGVVAAAGFLVAFAVGAVRNGMALYQEERITRPIAGR